MGKHSSHIYKEEATYPADTRMISGLNLWAHGTMTSSNADLIELSPEPKQNAERLDVRWKQNAER